MSTKITLIEPGSLADRVCRWFAISSNRGEELNATEIARKFTCPTPAIATKELMPAISLGLLVFTQGEKTMVYQAGPRLSAWVGGGALQAAMAPAKKAKVVRSPLPEIDLTKLKVRSNVPLPAKRNRQKGHTRWDTLFDKLDAVGQSVLLPRAYYPALAKAAQAYAVRTKRKVAIRHVDEAQCGAWRTE